MNNKNISKMFNKEFIKNNFYFSDEKFVFFNHGTFGICPRPVLEEKFNILRRFEANPVIGFAETMFDGCIENTKILANKLGVSYKNVAVIENVTNGFQTIIKSIEIKGEEEILLTNYTYAAVKMIVEGIMGKKGFVIRILNLEFPFKSNEEIINLYETFLSKHPNIKYAIVDHIASGLPFVQPIKEITKVLKQHGVFVMIDGAHGPGQIKDLNINDIAADIYIGNLHKWNFLPRGTGFIVVGENVKLNIQPPVISYMHDKELFFRFVYMGTNDISNLLCIKAAFDFVDSLGGLDIIHCVITDVLERGTTYLEKQWNVKVLTFPEMAPFMRVVPLPNGFSKYKDMILKSISIPFQREYYTFTTINLKFVVAIININDRMHFRICCHIYNNFEHFVQFSKSVLSWLELLDNGGGQINL